MPTQCSQQYLFLTLVITGVSPFWKEIRTMSECRKCYWASSAAFHNGPVVDSGKEMRPKTARVVVSRSQQKVSGIQKQYQQQSKVIPAVCCGSLLLPRRVRRRVPRSVSLLCNQIPLEVVFFPLLTHLTLHIPFNLSCYDIVLFSKST